MMFVPCASSIYLVVKICLTFILLFWGVLSLRLLLRPGRSCESIERVLFWRPETNSMFWFQCVPSHALWVRSNQHTGDHSGGKPKSTPCVDSWICKSVCLPTFRRLSFLLVFYVSTDLPRTRILCHVLLLDRFYDPDHDDRLPRRSPSQRRFCGCWTSRVYRPGAC